MFSLFSHLLRVDFFMQTFHMANCIVSSFSCLFQGSLFKFSVKNFALELDQLCKTVTTGSENPNIQTGDFVIERGMARKLKCSVGMFESNAFESLNISIFDLRVPLHSEFSC